MSIEGIDVSENNGSITWAKVKAAGKKFAVIKLNEGDRIDTTASKERVAAMHKAGIIPGGYDFIRPRAGRTGAQEFKIHLRQAKKIGLYEKGDMRPVIDFEASGFNVNTWDGRRATMTYVSSWIHACFEATGHHPILYTGFFWRDAMSDPDTTFGCRLWYPSYPTLRLVPKAWGKDRVSIHQYSEKGAVPGVPGRCDLNRYILGAGGLASFKKNMCLQFER